MMKKQDDDERDIVKKIQSKIRKEFIFLENSNNIEYDFIKSQAQEICSYLNRVMISPFRLWESFILSNIEKDEIEFLNRFYLKKNEYGVIEPDTQRIEKVRV